MHDNTDPDNDPGFDYNELHQEALREIAANKDLPEEEEKKAPVEGVVEETPPTEKITPPVEEKPVEPAIDEAALAQRIADETSKNLLEAQQAREETQKQQELAQKDKYEEFAKEFNEKEGRLPTWKEVAEQIEKDAVARVREELSREATEREEVQQKAIAEAKATEEKQIARASEVLNANLEDLYTEGKLSRIKDSKNPSDQGVVELNALYKATYEENMRIDALNQVRTREGKPQLPAATLKEVFYTKYQKPSAQPAGENAPISRPSNPSVREGDVEEHSYEEIHNTSMRNLFRNPFKKN